MVGLFGSSDGCFGQLRRALVAAWVVVGGALAAPGGVHADQAPNCSGMVRMAEGWVPDPGRYMAAPRPGDAAKNEPTMVWAEVDHYETRFDGDLDSAGLVSTIVPVYRAMTLGAVLMQLDRVAPPDDPRGEAADAAESAIADAWATWAGGDASKPVPFDAARAILADAEQLCLA